MKDFITKDFIIEFVFVVTLLMVLQYYSYNRGYNAGEIEAYKICLGDQK